LSEHGGMMLTGENIICFANDWHNDPTSKHQVMKLLSKQNRVLWVNSIGMRRPNASSSDLKRIFVKLKNFLQGLEKIHEDLFIFTPIVLPLPSSSWARQINALLLRASLWYYRKQLGMKDFQLWTFVPTMVELAGKMGEKALIYYCVDEWSKFSFMDSEAMRSMEIRLLQKAAIVFVTADHLYRDKVQFNRNTFLVEHGVDHEHFSRAHNEYLDTPMDIRIIKKPILGFFGLIHEWIDLDLIEHVAKVKPEWSIVLIGKSSVDVSRFQRYANVHFLGQKSYATLPAYCKVFDVGLIPFVINELTLNVNPIKLREYLSAGLPVVSTALPEVEKYSAIVSIAHSGTEFVALIQKAFLNDSPENKIKRSSCMAGETWQNKIDYISECLGSVSK
jgi:glycosyltransferase involved in cell wall biosynthesis